MIGPNVLIKLVIHKKGAGTVCQESGVESREKVSVIQLLQYVDSTVQYHTVQSHSILQSM